jgi:hypothetical protein
VIDVHPQLRHFTPPRESAGKLPRRSKPPTRVPSPIGCAFSSYDAAKLYKVH